VSIPRPQTWHRDGSPTEIESREELIDHLSAGTLGGLTIQGLRLDVDPPGSDGPSGPLVFLDTIFSDVDRPGAGVAAAVAGRLTPRGPRWTHPCHRRRFRRGRGPN
jgi:hypothetical protein